MKIACIIENRVILLALYNYLSPRFYKISSINSIENLENYHLKESYDLILLSSDNVEIDSVSFFNNIKLNSKLRDIPIIFIENSISNTIDFFISKGIDDFIIWPFSSLQINKRLDSFMNCRLSNIGNVKLLNEKIQELSEVQSVMIESLSTLAEYRDPETGNHIKRTQNYVKALAIYLKKNKKFENFLSDENIELIYLSVPLHDIGKVGIKDDILLKPGKLTEGEFAQMKMHTTFGHETLKNAERKLKNNSFLRLADDVAYTHQEKWNGTGYPRGLKGEEIPLIGRLMAVADVYDALVSKRVYKRAMSHHEARAIILEGKGTHFDPDIVDAFLAIEETFRNIALIYSDDDYEDKISYNKFEHNSNIKTILLCEDSNLMLKLFTNQIMSLGYKVVTASNGKIALEHFQSYEIDLIITDLDMPVMDGYELVKVIRERNRAIPVFALTAAEFSMTKEELKTLGFDDFMLKPLDIDLLQLKLNKLNNV